MNRSVYSLVLTDEVIREIDRMAYEKGTSRSNIVNQILAEYVSYTTPEKRMHEIFSGMESVLKAADSLRVLLQPSENMFSLRSALTYKYNPTVKYSVELNRSPVPYLGELRVSVRSQSSTLKLYMLTFIKLWISMEEKYAGSVTCGVSEDKYVRRLTVNERNTSNNRNIGQSISEYIRLMDRSMNIFFENLNNPAFAEERIEEMVKRYYSDSPVIL